LSEAQDLITEIDDLRKREECKVKLILQNDPTAMTTTDMELVPLFSPSINENGKAFHLSVSWFIPKIMRVAQISSKSYRCLYEFSSEPLAKFGSLTKDMKFRRISYPSASIGCDEVVGSRYFPSGAKK
jgi:hypothetical protein